MASPKVVENLDVLEDRLASSTLVFHFLRFSCSICIEDQKLSIIALPRLAGGPAGPRSGRADLAAEDPCGELRSVWTLLRRASNYLCRTRPAPPTRRARCRGRGRDQSGPA